MQPTIKNPVGPIAILGVPFDNVTAADTLALVEEMVMSRQPHYGATVSVEFLMAAQEDVELRRILFDAHLILAEEKSLVTSSKVLGNALPEAVTVGLLVPQLLALAQQRGWGVYFLGHGAETIAGKVSPNFPKLKIAGTFSPPEKPLLEMDNAEILRKLREAKPHLLFVAFGCPKQEKWINMNFREAGVPFVLGVGNHFDSLFAPPAPEKTDKMLLWNFSRAVLGQRMKLGGGKSKEPVEEAQVLPDPFGNLIVRAPERLGAVEAQKCHAEWLRAVESSHVMFDLSDTVFADSTGIGVLIRLRRRARELGNQFILVAPKPAIEAALRTMKLDEFFTTQAAMAGARMMLESLVKTPAVSSGVEATELQIRWTGEVTALNAVELGVYTESELSQVSAGMTVVIDLSRVTFVDSTGIGLMLRFKKNLKRRDLNLQFKNPVESVRNVIRHTKLEEYLLEK